MPHDDMRTRWNGEASAATAKPKSNMVSQNGQGNGLSENVAREDPGMAGSKRSVRTLAGDTPSVGMRVCEGSGIGEGWLRDVVTGSLLAVLNQEGMKGSAMKGFRGCSVVVAAMLIMCANCVRIADKGAPTTVPREIATAMPSRSVHVKGVILEVLVPRAARAEAPLQMTVTLVNESSAPVVCGDFGDVPDCRISIVDPSTGKACPLTDRGRYYFGGDAPRAGYALGALKPGELRSWTMDLRKYFVLLKGQYELSLAMTMNPHEPSQSFDITVPSVQLDIRLDAPL